MTDFAKLVLDADTTGLKRGEKDLESLTNSATFAVQKVGLKMAALGAGLTAGVTLPLVGFGKAAFKTATDAEEMEGAFSVVFGNMSNDVRVWAEVTGNAMGRSTQEIQRGALAFQELFGKALDPKKAADLSKEFAVLTQDLASFKNLSNEVAQQKLFSGLTGEAEPLRAVGVFINDAAVQAKALELGIVAVNGKFTDQQKIIARAALIREQLAQADGDVLRTSESATNQIRRSQAAYEELQVVIGTKLIPVFTPLIEKIGSALDMFSKLPDGVQTTAVAFLGFSVVIGPILTAVGAIITIAPGVVAAFAAIKVAMLGLLANPILLGAAAIIAGIYYAWQNWDKIEPYITAVTDAITEFWNDNVQPILDAVMEKVRTVADFFETYFGDHIRDTINLVAALFRGDFAAAWDFAKSIVSRAVSAMVELLVGLGQKMYQFGVNIVEGLVRGIKAAPEAVWNALKDVVVGGVDRVKAFLGIKSPSKMFMEIGGFMMEGLALGITASGQIVDDALSKMGEGAEIQTVKIADTFKTMAENVLNSLQNLSNSIKSGGFLDILGSVINFGLQLGSAGAFGSSIQASINKAPGMANGGAVSAGQTYMVGENRPELFTPNQNGFITPSNDNGAQKVIVINDSSFAEVFVDGKIQAAAPAIASAGAQLATTRSQRMQTRRVR